jgi:DNA sulfur modification protein DndE
LLWLAAGCLAATLGPAASRLAAAPLEDYVARAPFAMPAVPTPSFPDRRFPITDYGAVGDGRTLATAAFARAIAACAAAGGGHVIIPAGLWVTGPIELRSNVDLHSERGALIQFTADHTAYPMVRRKDWAFVTISPIDFVPVSPIDGIDLQNVALTGEGIFDGAGESWRPVDRRKVTAAQWQALLAQGGAVSNGGAYWWPTREAMTGEDFLIDLSRRTAHPTAEDTLPGRDFRRPPLCYLDNCRTVLVAGVTLRNGPCGLLCPTRCVDLTIRDATLFNEWWAQTGDGMDINLCRNVLVYHCSVSAGDDGICLKSTGLDVPKGDAGLRNVIVAECTVALAHGGFVLGGYTEDGMRNVWATDCDFLGSDVGIRVKSGRGHGGLVHAVTIDHIYMKDIVNEAILFDTHYDNHPISVQHPTTHGAAWFATHTEDAATAADEETEIPEFSDFLISDVDCLGAGTAISLTGLPQQPLRRITIRDAVITARRGLHATDAADILIQRVQIHTPETPAVDTRHTTGFRVVD